MFQSKVILGFIIFIGFASGYLYYSQTSETIVDTGSVPLDSNLRYFEKAKLNFSILEDERYKSLELYGEVPVDPGVTGRKNVFKPTE